MKSKLEQGKEEFCNENFEDALKYFESIDCDEEDYDISLVYRVSCLIHLNRYREALSYLDNMIETFPDGFLLWFYKVRCHIFLKEDDKVDYSMVRLEGVVDKTDKQDLLCISKLHNYLHNDLKAIEYADMALKIDENFRDALQEKYLAAVRMGDEKLESEILQKLYDISDKSIIGSTPMFLKKIFSKDYRGALDVLNNIVDDEVDGSQILLLKSAVYKHLSENLSAQLMLDQNIDLSVDDAIKLMLDFKEKGIDHGKVHGVNYFIL